MHNSCRFKLTLLGSLAASGVAATGAAWADARTFDVAAQPAATGAEAFARQADVQILISRSAAEGRQTQAVHGAYQPQTALAMLLRGTGLRAAAAGPGAYSLVAEGAAEPQTAPDPAGRAATTEVEQVVVTGTRIVRPNTTSAAPITTITRQDLQLEGLVNIEDVLNQLPQVRGDSTQFTNGGDTNGRAKVNLRDLGYQRTLLLLDGVRLLPAQAVDLNIIPDALVTRIDVLTGGASSVYGSDAVAGVVNFILDKKFNGLQVNESYGFYQHDNNDTSFQKIAGQYPSVVVPKGGVVDGDRENINAALGHDFDNHRGNISMFFDYRSQDPVRFSARDYSSCRIRIVSNNTALGCQVNTTYNAYGTLSPNAGPNSGNLYFNSMDGSGALIPSSSAVNTQYAINTRGDWNFLRSDERFNQGTFVNYKVSDALELYANGLFMRDRSDAQFYYGLVGPSAFNINCNNPFLSTSQASTLCGGAAGSGRSTSVTIAQELNGPGSKPLRNQSFNNEYRLNIGARGAFGGGWRYDVNALYSRVNTGISDLNEIDESKLANTLNVVNVNGAATCASNFSGQDPGCVPANIFGYHKVDPKVYPYIYQNFYWSSATFEEDFTANVTGDLTRYGAKSPWSDDGAAVSVGAEYRKDAINEKANAAAMAYEGYLSDLKGSFGAYEFYGELDLPLLAHLPFADALDFSTGYRVSKYDNQSKFLATYKDEIKYRPVHDVLLRASVNRAARAPNVNELFTPALFSTTGVSDPCSGATPAASSAACARSGVTPAEYGHIADCNSGGVGGACTTYGGGNAKLLPETATTKTLGVVYTPSFLHGLLASIDYYDIEIANFIGPVYANDALTRCVSSGLSYYCRFVHRDPTTGSLSGNPNAGTFLTSGYIADGAQNTDLLASKGIDFALSYERSIGSYGRIGASLNGSYDLEHDVRTSPLDPITNCVGYFGNNCYIPRPAWKHTLRTTWTSPQGYIVSLNWRFLGGAKLAANSADPVINGGSAPYTVLTKIPDYNYFDLSGEVPLPRGTKLRMSVNNIFDKTPPVVPSAFVDGTTNNPNTWTNIYDPLGRTALITLSLRY